MTHMVLTRPPMARFWMVFALVIGAFGALACTNGANAEQTASTEPVTLSDSSDAPSTSITTGSGEAYKTIVDRHTEGELSTEDFRQVSLMTARVVNHLNTAARHLADDNSDLAREEIEKGRALVKIVRDLLPTTVVTTTVQDASGTEVYRDVDRIQEDRIPLFQGLIAVEVVEPITEAKQDAAALKGLRLADAELLHTSVLVELPYVERKLNAALRLLKKPEAALAQLVLAQTRGITYDVNEQDNPLVEAQLALQLAERMVEQDRPQAAKANLQLARNHVEVYRGLLDKDEADAIGEVAERIGSLVENIGIENAAEQIRGIWDSVADLMTQQTGEVRASETDASEDDKKEGES